MASVFIQERLQQALEGWSYTPTVDAVLNAPKSKQVTAPPVAHPAGTVHSSQRPICDWRAVLPLRRGQRSEGRVTQDSIEVLARMPAAHF